MTFAPPWIDSGSSLSTLIAHENLHVTSGGADGVVWIAIIAAAFFISMQRLLLRRWLQGICATLLSFILVVSSGTTLDEQGTLVLKSDPEILAAVALGCTPAELTATGCPGQSVGDEQMTRLFELSARAANALNEQECIFIGSSIKDVIACATSIPPTSLRQVFGHVEHKMPSNKCQELDAPSRMTHANVLYELVDGSFAAGKRERIVICFNPAEQKMAFLEIDDVWKKDLKWLLTGSL